MTSKNLEKYECISDLKNAKGITTFIAVERGRGRQNFLVKKSAQNLFAPSLLTVMRSTFEKLAALNNPVIVLPVELQLEADEAFLVAPCLEGQTLAQALESGPFPFQRALRVTSEILGALMQMHGSGVICNELKPSNIFFEKDSLRILDFVFSRSRVLSDASHVLTAEDVRYLSPEQAGLLKVDVGLRSDLYATGLLLYEMLTATPVFSSDETSDILRNHMQLAAPDPRTIVPEIPKLVCDLVQHFLQVEPRNRYQNAESAHLDIMALLGIFEGNTGSGDFIVGTHDHGAGLREPAFVGRDDELASIVSAVSQTREGKGGIVTLEATSGGGKSRLLREFTFEMRKMKIQTLSGHLPDRTTMRPLLAFEGALEALLNLCRSNEHLRQRLVGSMRDYAEVLCKTLPVFEELFPGLQKGTTKTQDAFAEYPALKALSEFLQALGSKEFPVVIVLDDSQWLDGMMLKLLAFWQREIEGKESWLCFVLGMRQDEVDADHPIRKLTTSCQLKLKPFGMKETSLLLESMAGTLPEVIREIVHGFADGNPFMTAEILRGIVECGALTEDAGQWKIEESQLGSIRSSRKSAQILSRRLYTLSADTLHVLKICSVIGKEFSIDLIAAVSDFESSRYLDCLLEARQRHIIWMESGGSKFAFMHDKLREVLLSETDEKEKRSVHENLARFLKEKYPERSFEISYHFSEAHMYADAFPFAIVAAEEARSRFELETSQTHYKIAFRNIKNASRGQCHNLHSGFAEVLVMLKNYDEAMTHFESALSCADSNIQRAKVVSGIAEIYNRRGLTARANEEQIRALQILGRKVPTSKGSVVFALLIQLGVLYARILFPRLRARKKLEGGEAGLLSSQIATRLAVTYYIVASPVFSVWSYLIALNIAESYPETAELGMALSNWGLALAATFIRKPAMSFAQRGLRVCVDCKDSYATAFVTHRIGAIQYMCANYEEALLSIHEAKKVFDRFGDQWESATASAHMSGILYRLGRMSDVPVNAARGIASAKEVNNIYGELLNIYALASALAKVPHELIQHQLDNPLPGNLPVIFRAFCNSMYQFRNGSFRQASDLMEEAVEIVKRNKNDHCVRCIAVLPMIYRYELMHLKAEDTARRSELLNKLISATAEAKKVAKKSINIRAFVMREAAMAEAIKGNPKKALALINAQIHHAKKVKAQAELALGLFAKSEFTRMLGLGGSREDKASALQMLHDCEAAELEFDPEISRFAVEKSKVTVSLIDRFSSIIVEGRNLVSSLSENIVFEAIEGAAANLLRGETCQIIAPSKLDVLDALDFEIKKNQNQSAVLVGAEAIDIFERVFHITPQSALLAAISVRGKVVAVLCVSHSGLSDLFGEEETRISEYIVILGGAALENAEGFQNVKALTSDLMHLMEEGKRISACGTYLELSMTLKQAFDSTLGRKIGADLYFADKCFLENTLTQGFYPIDAAGTIQLAARIEENSQSQGTWMQVKDTRTGELFSIISLVNSDSLPDKELSILQSLTNNAANAISAIRLQAAMNIVEARTSEIRSIFSSLNQGIFTLDADLRVGPEYSAYLDTLTGRTHLAGLTLDEVLLSSSDLSHESKDLIATVLGTSIESDSFVFDGNKHLLPIEMTRAGASGQQILQVDWIPLYNADDSIVRIMVAVRDITELRKLQTLNEQRRRQMALAEEILEVNSRKFAQFVGDTKAALEKIKDWCESGRTPDSEQEKTLKRIAHTLKGNSRMYGFSEFSAKIHLLEGALFAGPKTSFQFSDETRHELISTEEMLATYEKLNTRMMMRSVTSGSETEQLTFADLLETLKKALSNLAIRIGKPIPQFEFNPVHLSVAAGISNALMGTLTHILQNCVDHGLPKEERGVLFFHLIEKHRFVEIRIWDSGPGLALDRLRQKGLKAGLISENSDNASVAELIFAAGLSTADKVSEVSGKGVGMDAARGMIQEMGGSVKVELDASRPQSVAERHPFAFVLNIPSSHFKKTAEDSSANSFQKAS